jgi:hypothetical protein
MSEKPQPQTQPREAAWLSLVKKQVGALRFGVIQIIVHDGRVVQIEHTEKIRFPETFRPMEGI